jgi:hypothetical protein
LKKSIISSSPVVHLGYASVLLIDGIELRNKRGIVEILPDHG